MLNDGWVRNGVRIKDKLDVTIGDLKKFELS